MGSVRGALLGDAAAVSAVASLQLLVCPVAIVWLVQCGASPSTPQFNSYSQSIARLQQNGNQIFHDTHYNLESSPPNYNKITHPTTSATKPKYSFLTVDPASATSPGILNLILRILPLSSPFNVCASSCNSFSGLASGIFEASSMICDPNSAENARSQNNPTPPLALVAPVQPSVFIRRRCLPFSTLPARTDSLGMIGVSELVTYNSALHQHNQIVAERKERNLHAESVSPVISSRHSTAIPTPSRHRIMVSESKQ